MKPSLGRMSAARRRRERLVRLQWVCALIAVSAAGAVGLLAPTAADAILVFFLTAIVVILATRGSPALALIAIPVAVAAYRGSLDLSWRAQASGLLTLVILALFLSASVSALTAARLRKEDRAIRFSSSLPNCVAYDVLTLLLAKDIARCQRYKGTGSLALIHLRHLEPLLKPASYQQHDLVLAHVAATVAHNVRSSDTICYLGDMHLAIAFPHTNEQQAWVALERLKGILAPLPQRLCPGLGLGVLDWEAVCLQYPQDGPTPAILLENAAATLSEGAQLRLAALEKQQATIRRQPQRLDCA